ncbi:MAG TPA: glutamine--fructose-6-phosphate transaminase (isomerizing) [Oligoflexia bacterium]|nr:glutamine--fructose-6-phosphate transaminase (isomerizing) [Oligoflexia bacterium]HMP49653.1 glutamine--fructose-6-phosphate transaminase (isomerizing) [Oligoflexia bacterium]
MCGIVGYVGPRNAIPLIINGLEKLEYRGYDSAGVATVKGSGFELFRTEGKLSNLRNRLIEHGRYGSDSDRKDSNSIGIGHTRWATHGRPSETNAHPHIAGDICLVHNGIIENYVDLRSKLLETGCKFSSETDTEIAAHLVESKLKNSSNLFEAVEKAISELSGSYALVVMSSSYPDSLVVAKNATPVVIGVAEGEMFVASDIPAILEHTRDVIILEDGEMAEIRASGVIVSKDGRRVERPPTRILWDPVTASKGGYKHFMLKEIHEQPQVVTETFRGRIEQDTGQVFIDDLGLTLDEVKSIKRISIVACGTAWHSGLVAKFYFETVAKIPTEVDYASEFRYREPLLDNGTLFLVISQSGETADTLGCLQLATQLTDKTMAVCNVLGSSMSRKARSVFYTHAGPEISVASTKAFVTQLTAVYLLSLHFAEARGVLSSEEVRSHTNDLMHLPSMLSSAIDTEKQVERIAKKYGKSEGFLFLGRGILYPIALEGALKLKEISYLHAEGYPAGEMKHGPIALINEELPVIVLIGKDGVNHEKAMSNLMEVAARGGRIIAVTDEASPELKDLAWETVSLGKVPPLLMPMVFAVPLQLLAYHVAVYRGTDVDQPRNLAKSVTVE